MSPTLLIRGDVVLSPFPFTDLSGAAQRPALIVSTGIIGNDLVIAAISSVVRGGGVPTDYVISTTDPQLALTGLRVTSVVRCHKLVAV